MHPAHHLTSPRLPKRTHTIYMNNLSFVRPTRYIYSYRPADAMISKSDASSSPAAWKTYAATTNPGSSANTLWHDIKTFRWVVEPGEGCSFITRSNSVPHPFNACLSIYLASALKLLLIPVVLYVSWEFLAPFVATKDTPNPFSPLIFISHPIPNPNPNPNPPPPPPPSSDPRYAKSHLDLPFLTYHIILFSFLRQTITTTLCRPLARYFGIRKPAKIDRFGEQGYALVYFGGMGVWGLVSFLLPCVRAWLIGERG